MVTLVGSRLQFVDIFIDFRSCWTYLQQKHLRITGSGNEFQIHEVTVHGCTALHVACLTGHSELVEALSAWSAHESPDSSGLPSSGSLLFQRATHLARLPSSLEFPLCGGCKRMQTFATPTRSWTHRFTLRRCMGTSKLRRSSLKNCWHKKIEKRVSFLSSHLFYKYEQICSSVSTSAVDSNTVCFCTNE